MEIKLKDFIKTGEIVSFVHFSGSFRKLKNNANISYVLDIPYRQNMLVHNYLKKNIPSFQAQRFYDACKMVLLDFSVFHKNLKDLSYTEMKKLRFVEALMYHSETIVFENFFRSFYGRDINYYRKLILKMTKYGKSILFITDEITDLFGLVKQFVLFSENKYEWIDDFYDERIYRYVAKPKIVSYVQYLNQRNISMEPYIEPKEVLKAIYRSVNSGEHL